MPSIHPLPARVGLALGSVLLCASAALAAGGGAPPPPAPDGGRSVDRGFGPPARSVAPPPARVAPTPGDRGRGDRSWGGRDWYDGGHGHARRYPAPGWRVRHVPRHSHAVWWAGVNYHFFDGVWYSPNPYGYVVVRPPYGIVVADLPSFTTSVLIGGVPYMYANGVYYRQRGEGGYEVVPPPVAGNAPREADTRMYVYPRAGQSAEEQASDEYQCHKWAVEQTGFDPTAVATATAGADPRGRDSYQRARTACLEGRNYTVR